MQNNLFGRGSRTRTHDIRFWRPTFYQLNYTPLLSGAQSRNRTSDTRIFSPLLYRLSYLGELKRKVLKFPFKLEIFLDYSRNIYMVGLQGLEPRTYRL